jgi:predicted enzyme related to lactoylglutathione lyase
MARVVHFEISADEPKRAVKFYEQALGWKIQEYPGGGADYWLASTGPDDADGINGAIQGRSSPGETTVVSVSVEKIEASMDAVRKAGGIIVGEIMDIPNVGRFVYATDSEGNRFGMLEALPRER